MTNNNEIRYRKCLNYIAKFAKNKADLQQIIEEIEKMSKTVNLFPEEKNSGIRLYLQNGGYTLIDEEDYEFINQWKWSLNTRGYVCRSVYSPDKKKRKRIYLHREVMKTPEKLICDHINGDSLDNRKVNLRNANVKQNAANSKAHKNSSSKYKGVHIAKGRKKKYRSVIVNDGKRIELGSFYDEIEAAKAYNEAALEYFGEYARLNHV